MSAAIRIYTLFPAVGGFSVKTVNYHGTELKGSTK
jgi:hypothetical protein